MVERIKDTQGVPFPDREFILGSEKSVENAKSVSIVMTLFLWIFYSPDHKFLAISGAMPLPSWWNLWKIAYSE